MTRIPCILAFGAVLAACGSSAGNVASLTTSPSSATTARPPLTSPGPAPTIGAPAPRTLVVTCVGKAIHLSASSVQAQADGIHLSVTFTSRGGGDFSYTSFNSNGSSNGSGIGVLSPGPWREVYPLAPGKASLRCARVDAGASSSAKAVEVLDPHHYWTPIADPSCRLASVQANGPGATAVEAVQNWLATNGHVHDQVAMLGYPRDPGPTIGVTDHSKLVARISVFSTGGSGPRSWSMLGGACATFHQTPATLPR